jgi:hypothetical protein
LPAFYFRSLDSLSARISSVQGHPSIPSERPDFRGQISIVIVSPLLSRFLAKSYTLMNPIAYPT